MKRAALIITVKGLTGLAATWEAIASRLGATSLLTRHLLWYVLANMSHGPALCLLGGGGAWLILATMPPLGYGHRDGWISRGAWQDAVRASGVERGAGLAARAIDRWSTSGIILKLGATSPRRV
jgi:hypothetical protein